MARKRSESAGYERHRESMAEESRERSAAARDIGPIPPVDDQARRDRGEEDPEFFHRTYFPNRFKLPFGSAHRAAIRTMAECTEQGGLFALTMMRGGGKTTLADCEVIRALAYGFRRFVVFIGATDPLACKAVKRIWREFETNDLLLADFPEVCFPIRRLERIAHRCNGQTSEGRPTRMEKSDGHIGLPTIAGSRSSGSVIQAFGLTGALKGANILGPDGEPLRPDLVLLDDCQTRESAGSPTQTADRERIILQDVLGLAGPETELAAVFLCTPIYEDDLTERFVDREKRPEWQGVRTKMVERFPDRMDLWDEYHEVRRRSFRAGNRGRDGVEFYRQRQAEMDAGCVLAWPDRKKKADLSAVQTAMNLFLTDPVGFRSEYQCEPQKEDGPADAKQVDPKAVAGRLSGTPRNAVPDECSRLTLFVDPGGGRGRGIWYAVTAWDERFGGTVIDYGTWPRQKRSTFAAADMRPGLAELYPTLDAGQRLYAGLDALTRELFDRLWPRAGGDGELPIDLGLIDSGWLTDTVTAFVRESPYAARLLPSKGIARSDTSAGVAGWKGRPGEKVLTHARVTAGVGGKGRSVQFDPDYWKSFVLQRLLAPPGGAGCLRLFGRPEPRASAPDHSLFAEHCGAEYACPKAVKGDVFDKWRMLPGRSDNHWWDCLSGTAVAANVAGLNWEPSPLGRKPAPPPKRKRTWREIQAEKMRAKG